MTWSYLRRVGWRAVTAVPAVGPAGLKTSAASKDVADYGGWESQNTQKSYET